MRVALAGAILLAAAACTHTVKAGEEPPMPPDPPGQAAGEAHPTDGIPGGTGTVAVPDGPEGAQTEHVAFPPVVQASPVPEPRAGQAGGEADPAPSAAEAGDEPGTAPSAGTAPEVEGRPAGSGNGGNGNGSAAGRTTTPPKKEAPAPEAGARRDVAGEPSWVRTKETLNYRLTFLGVTAGYARFTVMGRKTIEGREVYHLHVRAWTSQFLSWFYQLNNVMDYYLDAKTLVPLRIEVTKTEKKKFRDEVVLYDQEKGVIRYWDRQMRNMRKKVEVPPYVHDPVSVVYSYRLPDGGNFDRPRMLYGGRKLYQVSARYLGTEKIPDARLVPVDTLCYQPVIRRDGKIDNKGDIRIWMTNDDRRIPLRIYANIKIGKVVGQLVPDQEGG